MPPAGLPADGTDLRMPSPALATAAPAPAAPTMAPRPATAAAGRESFPVQPAAYFPPSVPPSLPPDAWTGEPPVYGCGDVCGGMQAGAEAAVCGPNWRPPGIGGVWPQDEYLFDGGDHPPAVEVLGNWNVLGLDQEDTVAHYDTLDGRTEVEPANRVPVYAPRFAAVRKVSGVAMNRQRGWAVGVELPAAVQLNQERRIATTVHQPIQPGRYLGIDGSQSFRDTALASDINVGVRLDRISNRFKPYEDFQVIRNGSFDNSEKARLAERTLAAQAWMSDQSVQIVLDEVIASLASGTSAAEAVYRYELPEGKPRLRVIKVASRRQAQPGDEIEFTIRFDNVGDQTIGNVTIIDNLTTRLEYIPDSAECSPAANFLTQENEGESLVLRWEVIEPLAVGEGGLARFRCRVR